MHDRMPYGQNQGQGHSREVDRQSPTGLIFINIRILSVSVENYPYPYPIHSDVVNCYPYPLRIRGSIMVQLDRESKKFSPDIFDCSFNIDCQILIVFLAQVYPI